MIFCLCFACEFIDSGLGMGYGTILLSELLSGFTAAFFHNDIKNVDLGIRGRDLKPALALSCLTIFKALELY